VLGEARLIGFVATSDADWARAFYGDKLGLKLVEDSQHALVFDAGGTKLRVTPVEKIVVPPYTVLGLQVDDIAAAVRALTERGVTFARFAGMPQDALGIWNVADGTKVAWFKDPDGNVLSLTEFARR